jgi:formylglycine-generating enzyme required for sulfatase activity
MDQRKRSFSIMPKAMALMVALAAIVLGGGVFAQESDEPVAVGTVFDIGKAEVGLEEDFSVKPKVQSTYTHPVTDKAGLKASAKVVNKIGPKDPVDTAVCEWTKRILLYDKKLLSAANKAGMFTAAWLALLENAAQNQPLALPLALTSKQVPENVLDLTLHLSPPLIYDVEIADGLITITGLWFGTKKPRVWFEYLDAKSSVKRLNCKVEKPDGQEGRVNAKQKPVYMNPVDGASKVVVLQPKLPRGVASLDDLSHVVLDSGSGLAADTETYTVTFDPTDKGVRTGGGELVQAVKHGDAAIAPDVAGNPGWVFTGWDLAFDRVVEPIIVTALYDVATYYTLTYTAGPNGTVDGLAQVTQTVVQGSDGAEVTAVPAAHHHFTGWSDGVLTAARTDTSVSGPLTVTANFAINTYTLTYTAGPNGTVNGLGQVTQTVVHGGNGTEVTAIPDASHHFTGWSDGVLTAARQDTSVSGPITVTAVFAIDEYTVTFQTDGTSGASLTGSTVQTIAHGASCSAVAANSPVSYSFTGWTGDYVGMDNPLTIASVTADMAITATFAIKTYTISGTVSGDIAQSVTITLSGDAAMTATTGVGGGYSFEVTAGSYTVTPTRDGYMFTPPSREVVIVDADSTENDFAAAFLYLIFDLQTGQVAKSIMPADLLTNAVYKTTKMVFRRIPAGTYTMGSPEGELGKGVNEIQHSVELTRDFYLGVFEVTQAQYNVVMGTWPSYFVNPTYRDTRPVEQVSWSAVRGGTWPSGNPAADSFMDKLRTLVDDSRYPFDLPTEAQWEHACRAGTTTALNSNKDLITIQVCANMAEVGRYWYDGGSAGAPESDLSAGSAEVGSYLPNAWNLYDMHGNVYEWCLDWYNADLGTDPVVDPAGGATGAGRVIRGGGWVGWAVNCRSAYRANFSTTDKNVGFRVALNTQWLDGDSLREYLEIYVDSKIAGKNPATTRKIFLEDTTEFPVTRNPNLWCAGDVQALTCLSPWNDQYFNCNSATLVTPLHIINALHYPLAIGTNVTFIDADGNVETREIVAGHGHPEGKDLALYRLDAPLDPARFTFARVLPDDWATKLPDLSSANPVPIIALSQFETAMIKDLSSDGPSFTIIQPPTDPQRLAFSADLIGKDSGSPGIMIVNGLPVVLTVWTTPGGGASISVNKATLDTMLDTLGGGYQLTEIDLSAFPTP